MTPTIFMKLPGTSTYVNVAKIAGWGPYGLSNHDKTIVRVEGYTADFTVDGTPDDFAEALFSLMNPALGLS